MATARPTTHALLMTVILERGASLKTNQVVFQIKGDTALKKKLKKKLTLPRILLPPFLLTVEVPLKDLNAISLSNLVKVRVEKRPGTHASLMEILVTRFAKLKPNQVVSHLSGDGALAKMLTLPRILLPPFLLAVEVPLMDLNALSLSYIWARPKTHALHLT